MPVEQLTKPVVLVLYASDGQAAKEYASHERAKDGSVNVMVRDATVFQDFEEAVRVITMPDVPPGMVERVRGMYPAQDGEEIVQPAEVEQAEREEGEDDVDPSSIEIKRSAGMFYLMVGRKKISKGYRRRSDAEGFFEATYPETPVPGV